METNVYETINDGMKHPEDYWGSIVDYQDQGWMLCIGRHRDSDHLSNSNFETILKNFHEKYELNEDFRVEGASHWAVGWIDQMMIRAISCNCENWDDSDITVHPDAGSKGLKLWRCHTCGTDFGIENVRPIVYDMLDYEKRLADYPVLDEEDFSRREYEELMEWLEQEVASSIHRQTYEKIKDGFECDVQEVAEILFSDHNVSTVEDCDVEWIDETVFYLADKVGMRL